MIGVNFLRFPYFYSKSFVKVDDKKIVDFVASTEKKSITIFSLEEEDFRKRIVVDFAYTMQLERREYIPKFFYVYPGKRKYKTFRNCIALGKVIKGYREGIFLPLIPLRKLSEDEIKAIVESSKKLKITERYKELARMLGFEIIHVSELEFTLKIFEKEFWVVISEDGKVVDTNVCIEFSELYFPEFLCLLKDNPDFFVYLE